MIRFEWLETLGAVAGMTDCGDGDCAVQDDPQCRDHRVRVVRGGNLGLKPQATRAPSVLKHAEHGLRVREMTRVW